VQSELNDNQTDVTEIELNMFCVDLSDSP